MVEREGVEARRIPDVEADRGEIEAPLAESAPEPPAALLIDLAPASPSEAAPSDLPPAPDQIAAPDVPQPEMDEEETVEPPPEPVVVPPPEPVTKDDLEPMAEIVAVLAPLPRPRPDVVPEIKPTEPPPRRETRREKRRKAARPRAPATTAPSTAPRPAQAAAAPQIGSSASAPSISPQRWQSAVYRHLERHKRYPSGARNMSGTIQVRFTIDRNGNILSHHITRSSGHPELDQAVSAMISRASPVPAPPAELFRPGMRVEVPIRFSPR